MQVFTREDVLLTQRIRCPVPDEESNSLLQVDGVRNCGGKQRKVR